MELLRPAASFLSCNGTGLRSRCVSAESPPEEEEEEEERGRPSETAKSGRVARCLNGTGSRKLRQT
jgi:hypothetical protein